MGFYTPLVLVIGALVWAFTHDLNRVIAVLVVSLPVRLHPGHAHRDGRRALRRRAPGHPDQERRRHRSWPRRSTRSSSTRPARSPPANWRSAAWRRSADVKPAELLRIAAVGREIQQPSRRPRRWRNWPAKPACRWPSRKDFAETAGRGVKAEVDGAKVLVGRAQWLKDNGVTGRFPEVGGPERDRGLEPDLRGARRPVHRLGRLAGPDPRRGAGVAGRAEGQRRAAHRDGLRRPPARGHARGARRSAARKPWANACRRTRSSLCAPSRPRATGGGGGRRRERRARRWPPATSASRWARRAAKWPSTARPSR